MDPLTIILLLGGCITLLFLACAFEAFRKSWPAFMAYFYPSERTRIAEPRRHPESIEHAIYGLLWLAAASFVGDWTLTVWGLSQA